MYISVPKNYSGNAFRPGLAGPMPMPVMPASWPASGERRSQMQQTETPVRIPQTLPAQPEPPQEPEDSVLETENAEANETVPAAHISLDRDDSECRREKCDDCGAKNAKNPLSSLLEMLHGRGNAGFDLEDFLLIGLIVLLMGKEGNEDIVLILAMLLLI